MKNSIVLKSIVTAVLLTTIVSLIPLTVFAVDSYIHEKAEEAGGNWRCMAENKIYYDPYTYVINEDTSSIDTDAWAHWPLSFVIDTERLIMTYYNSEAYVSGDYHSAAGDWYAYAWAWTYPSYWQNSSGSTSDWYFT